MIDLHSHILPGIDDGAPDLAVALEMARGYVADGVVAVACTPHILPGVYHNTGPQIWAHVAALQRALDEAGISLRLVAGADNHIVPDLVAGLQSGHLLSLADSRYVLIEPPHSVAPQRMDELFFAVQAAGFVPILTHPERLTWLAQHYGTVKRMVETGVWMQLTAGSLTGAFGRNAQYWAERMLDEGAVHILASDAHDAIRRPPRLSEGFCTAARRIGEAEAANLVLYRPRGILENASPAALPAPPGLVGGSGVRHGLAMESDGAEERGSTSAPGSGRAALGGLAQRLRRILQ